MKRYNTLTKSLTLYLLLALPSCGQKEEQKEGQAKSLPYYSDATFTPHWFEKGDEALNNFHAIPAFELINQNGETITQSTFDGSIYIADFFFTTCPGICPKMTTNMVKLQEVFEGVDDVKLVSYSVTPEIDGVEQLANYAEAKGINSAKWHLLTGDRQVIYHLGRKAYFVEEDLGLEKTDDEFLHTENFVLVDPNRHIRGIYNGLNKASVQQLIDDIKTLKEEFSTETLASLNH